jgi:hypothetical protein
LALHGSFSIEEGGSPKVNRSGAGKVDVKEWYKGTKGNAGKARKYL